MRSSPLYEVVGQMGFWGTLINGIQAAGLEWKMMRDSTWNGATGGIYCMLPCPPKLTPSVNSQLESLSRTQRVSN